MSGLLHDERCIVIQPSLVRRLGNMHDAAVLQQLHYWMPRATAVHDGTRWVYKTYDDWGTEIGLTAKQARHAINRLEGLGVIISCQPEAWQRRKWYRIEYQHELLSASATEGRCSSPAGRVQAPQRAHPSAPQGASITESTQESTQESTEIELAPAPQRPAKQLATVDAESQNRLDEAQRLANLLADLVAGNGARRPVVTAKWVQTIDRMIRLDERSAEQIESAMRWAQGHDFWASNILSPDSLRRHYDRLRMQAQRDQRRAGPRGFDGVRAFLDSLDGASTVVEVGEVE